MDCIRLRDLVVFPRLGVTDWEKEGVQKVWLDVELYLDLARAGKEDRIQVAVDYSIVHAAVQQVAKARKYHLIEALAEAVCEDILVQFGAVESVRVRLRKRSLPFDALLDCVEVEMERRR